MSDPFPTPGQVFKYHYLWKWQFDQGETEGRKIRPSCVAIVTATKQGETAIFVAPITTKRPAEGRFAIAIPEMEKIRAGLETAADLWVIVDELNFDILERSYTLEDRAPLGAFSAKFTRQLVQGIQTIRKTGSLSLSDRT